MPATPTLQQPLPPRPPLSVRNSQQLVDEQVACLRTLCGALSQSLAALRDPDRPPTDLLSLTDTREFIELIGALAESDTCPSRLRTLVLDAQACPLRVLVHHAQISPEEAAPRGSTQQGFTAQGWSNAQVQCIQTVTRIIGLCSQVPEISGDVFNELRDGGGVDSILRILAQRGQDDGDMLRVAAAECLFVCVGRIPAARDAMVRTRTVSFLSDLLWKEEAAMVRNYLCAMLRAISEHYPEVLLDATFAERAITSLEREESKYVAILLLDILAQVFREYAAFYLGRVQVVPGLVSSLCRLCFGVLHMNTQLDVVTAVCGLMEAVAKAEASERERTSFLTELFGGEAWKALVLGVDTPESGEVAALKLRCLLRCLSSCTTEGLMAAMQDGVCGSPGLARTLLHATDNPQLPDTLRLEAAAVALLMAAKSPRVRLFFRTLLMAEPQCVPGVRRGLCAAVQGDEPVAEVTSELLRKVQIIDTHLTYINNPAPVSRTASWADFRGLCGIAGQILAEQEAGTSADSTLPLAEDSIEFVDRRSTSGLSAIDQRERLTAALLCCCVDIMTSSEQRSRSLRRSHPPSPAAGDHSQRQYREGSGLQQQLQQRIQQLPQAERHDFLSYQPQPAARSPSFSFAGDRHHPPASPQVPSASRQQPPSPTQFGEPAWGTPGAWVPPQADVPPSPIRPRPDVGMSVVSAESAADDAQLLQSLEAPWQQHQRQQTQHLPLAPQHQQLPLTPDCSPPRPQLAQDPLAARPAWPPWPPPQMQEARERHSALRAAVNMQPRPNTGWAHLSSTYSRVSDRGPSPVPGHRAAPAVSVRRQLDAVQGRRWR